MDTSYLDEYEISIEDTESTNVSDVNKEEIKLRNALYTACKLNDIVTVKRLLQPLSIKNKTTSSCDNSRMTSDCLLVVMNSAFGKHETTLLHITSEQGYNELTWILLENGADPAVHNKNGLTPYLCAANKTIRKTFARFMTSFPEKYNYVSAQVS